MHQNLISPLTWTNAPSRTLRDLHSGESIRSDGCCTGRSSRSTHLVYLACSQNTWIPGGFEFTRVHRLRKYTCMLLCKPDILHVATYQPKSSASRQHTRSTASPIEMSSWPSTSVAVAHAGLQVCNKQCSSRRNEAENSFCMPCSDSRFSVANQRQRGRNIGLPCDPSIVRPHPNT